MCGIAGILNFRNGFSEQDVFRLSRMVKAIAHRGPDDSGIVLLGPGGTSSSTDPLNFQGTLDINNAPEKYRLGLGNQRLSILDLSPSGRMPMCNEDRSVWITYNGEIYNYNELAQELKEKGHQFRSRTDTEVVLHAYEEWGSDAVIRFNGMWAFALWDAKRGRLWLCRDRFGIKPLYFFSDGARLIFASEVKAIRAAGILSDPNISYLAYFLQSGLICDGEETFHENIKQLLPASSMIISGDGVINIEKYWSYPKGSTQECGDVNALADQFREIFENSIRLRLRSDVAVGACLSGGLDSTSIVSMYRAISPEAELHTFSVIFDEKQYNETENIDLVLKSLDVNHHYVLATADGFLESIPIIVHALDGPNLSPPTYAYWLMLTKVKDLVKVLMDGQGADELLAGYGNFQMGWLTSALRRAIRGGGLDANLLKGVGDILHGNLWPLKLHVGFWLRENFATARHCQNLFSPHRRIFRKHEPTVDPDRSYLAPYYDEPLTDLLYQFHSKRVLPGLLQYGDALSMSSSVEVRFPFMDYRLVEFVFGLKYNMKHSGIESKFILRKAMDGILPEPIRSSRKKVGFAIPFAIWLRNSLRGPVQDILLSPTAKLRDYVDYEILTKMLNSHMENKTDESPYLWRYLLTEVWLQNYKKFDEAEH